MTTTRNSLDWQSKLVLLLTFPAIGAGLVLEGAWWATNLPQVAEWAVGLSLLLGLAAWKTGTATRWAAAAGTAIAASIALATAVYPYRPWETGLVPLLTLLVLTSLATRVGGARKESLGAAESRAGRRAAQVAANLGVAALAFSQPVQSWLLDSHWFSMGGTGPMLVFTVGLAALAESAADTVSSEIGQVLGGAPRMLTTLRRVEPGTDGAVSWTGSAAGAAAAALVALSGAAVLHGGGAMFGIACAGGVFGLFFDSLLGATAERKGWINNDAVNYLSTLAAAAFALALLAMMKPLGGR